MSERPVHLGGKRLRAAARRRRRRQGGGGGEGEWRERRRRRDDSVVGSTSAVDVNLRPRFVTPDHKEFKFKASANWVDVRMISRVRFRPRINIPFAVNIQPQKLELVLSSKKLELVLASSKYRWLDG